MSRKFNMGRQNDLLLNEKLHSLYTHLEFISYKDGDGNTITMPRQTKQTAIPKGALWLQHPMDTNMHKLRVHTNPEASNMEERWPCLFEGYYHPANVKATSLPTNPVHGQLWIDDKNVLRVYNASTAEGKWDLVLTGEFTEEKYDVFNGLDFQSIDPLLPIELDSGQNLNIYAVPFESFGKYFTASNHDDEFIYCHPPVGESIRTAIPNYSPQQSENVISVDGASNDYQAKAWIHVNPYNLNKITKRLVKIKKPKIYYKALDVNSIANIKSGYDKQGNPIRFLQNEDGSKTRVYEVVSNGTKLAEMKSSYMIKVKNANEKKYNESIDFVEGQWLVSLEIRDQNTGFIAITAGTTEYYAFKSLDSGGIDEYDNKIGRLLKRYALKEGITDDTINSGSLTEEEINEILDYRNDYEIVNGGIVLDDDIINEYDYIYAITYEFKNNHSIDGNLIRITRETLDGPDQIYVGQCSGIPVVFMDGLYLEHYDNGKSIYNYENENIVFAGDDVLDNMQILVVSFPKVNTYRDRWGIAYPKEYEIDENSIHIRYEMCYATDEGAKRVVKIPINDKTIAYDLVVAHTPDLKDQINDSGIYYVRKSGIEDVVIQGDVEDTLFNNPDDPSIDEENKFYNPLIFYNGLAGYTYIANEVDIDYENRIITIHDFGAINDENGESTIFAVSLGKDNEKGYGVLQDGVLYDERISADNAYLVIVDGIVMSPYNEDIIVEDGKITITEATVALDSECTFVKLTPSNDSLINDTDSIMVLYDDMFMPYSIPIVDKARMNTSNAYDDCDSAVVMCGPGALVDREAIQRDFSAQDEYVGGQIVKKRLQTYTKEEVYEWRQYTHSNEYIVLDPIEDRTIISDCENMMTYYANKGTVLLNPVRMDECPVTVYAYTYIDSVDEQLQRGKRVIPIEVQGHSQNNGKANTYSTNRMHLYDVGVNALSTYINGVMVNHTEKPTTDVKGDLFYINEQQSSLFIPFINRYREPDRINRFASQDMYNVLIALNDNSKLSDRITITTNIGTDTCLVEKFFNSEYQLEQAKALRRYILNDMRKNNMLYIIENVESGEFVSCRRQWELPRNENGNLPNSYVSNIKMVPTIINVYVNGVLLEKDDYAVFDNNKIMIGFDLVGGQEVLPKDKGDYQHPYRVLTDEGFKFIECEGNDIVTLETRDDLTIKKRTYNIKSISYETCSFDIIDYDYPESLSTTKDVIKIYINGVLYDGDYTNIDGVITLLECDLEEDPLYKYLRMHPSAMREYEEKYGEYIAHEDTITFEWR